MNINRYHFDSIVKKTKQLVSPILRGEEEGYYCDYLSLLEILMAAIYMKYDFNGRQLKEILQIVLFDIKSISEHVVYDCSDYEEEFYRDCINLIEKFFLPEKSPELMKRLKKPIKEDDEYFEFPRKLIIRIHESIDYWTKKFGPYGYIKFIERYLIAEAVVGEDFLVESKYFESKENL